MRTDNQKVYSAGSARESVDWALCKRYSYVMTTKENVLKAVQSLPDDAHIEDAMERLLLLAKIEKGLEQADAGKTISHDQVREKMAEWLK